MRGRTEVTPRAGKRGILLGLALILLSAALLLAFWPGLGEWAAGLLYPRQYREVVRQEAGEFELPEALVYAVIRAESGFDQKARSRAGAMGLMQLTEETFRWMAGEHPPENGGGDPYDPQDNIHCGCALLRRLLDHYGVPETALAAYNAGIGNVDRWLLDRTLSQDGKTLQTIPYPETAAYVKKVSKGWQIYQRLGGEG